MSLNQKCNSYIHFAVKANKVLWGLDMIKTSKFIPYVIIYDKALGGNSKKQMEYYAQENEVELIEVEENYLNDLLKRNNVKMIGIVDESLSNAILNNK